MLWVGPCLRGIRAGNYRRHLGRAEGMETGTVCNEGHPYTHNKEPPGITWALKGRTAVGSCGACAEADAVAGTLVSGGEG